MKFKLARGLRANNHPVYDERLIMGIVSWLPKAFSHDLGHLYDSCLGKDEDEVVSRISASAKFLGIDQHKAPSASANLVPPPRPRNAPTYEGVRPKGMPHDLPTEFRGCWFCLEDGHRRQNCQKYKDDCARRAAIMAGKGRSQNPVGGMAMIDSSDLGIVLTMGCRFWSFHTYLQ
eukprot:jgi/Botrbrau1/173/Bobra.0022s0155.1